MRVVLVSDSGSIQGGASKVAIMSARGLAEAGMNVTFVAACDSADAMLQHPRIEFVGLNLDPVNDMGTKARIRASIWRSEAVEPLRSALKPLASKDAIVHVHCYRDNLSAAGLRAILDMPARTIVTAHDYRLGCPVGDFYNGRAEAICPLTGGSLACWGTVCHVGGLAPKLLSNVRFAVAASRARVPKDIKEVIFVSDFQRERLGNYLARAKQHTLSNPIEFDQPTKVDLSANEGVVFIGRLQPGKDPETVAHVATALGCPSTFVGEGELRGSVQAIAPNAKIVGWVAPSEVSRYLRAARVHLFPARWYETQGLSVLEAAANGIPTVCLDTCAASDTIRRYGAGLIVPAGDRPAMVEATAQLLGPEGQAIGAQAYAKFWADPPDLAWHARKTLEIYEAA